MCLFLYLQLHSAGHYLIGGDPGGVRFFPLSPSPPPPNIHHAHTPRFRPDRLTGETNPKQDFFASPGDPLFYFHHGMLDRVWWIWQMQDPENRVNAIPGLGRGGGGGGGWPGHGGGHGRRQASNGSDIIIDLGWTAPPARLTDLNEQLGGLGGEFCYIYA